MSRILQREWELLRERPHGELTYGTTFNALVRANDPRILALIEERDAGNIETEEFYRRCNQVCAEAPTESINARFDEIKGWTLETAKANEEAWRTAGGRGCGPLQQWHVATRELTSLELSWKESRELKTLLKAVWFCSSASLPPPAWLGRAANELFETLEYGEYEDSRDLGVIFNIGAKPDAGERERKLRNSEILRTALEMRGDGERVQAIFQKVAVQFHKSEEFVKKLYYDYERLPKNSVVYSAMDDGWYYVKPARAPDSDYKRHCPLNENPFEVSTDSVENTTKTDR
ncbi:MAG: hypothetical protein AAGC91_01175 [Pseudomonadota bacterium]